MSSAACLSTAFASSWAWSNHLVKVSTASTVDIFVGSTPRGGCWLVSSSNGVWCIAAWILLLYAVDTKDLCLRNPMKALPIYKSRLKNEANHKCIVGVGRRTVHIWESMSVCCRWCRWDNGPICELPTETELMARACHYHRPEIC